MLAPGGSHPAVHECGPNDLHIQSDGRLDADGALNRSEPLTVRRLGLFNDAQRSVPHTEGENGEMAMDNPDRFNSILLSLTDLSWSRDEQLPEGTVCFTAVTDGRIIGCHKLLLTSDRTDVELLAIGSELQPRTTAIGEIVGQWNVGEGCYMGVAGARNSILFWVQDGVIVAIRGGSSEDWSHTHAHMVRRHEGGDLSVTATDEEAIALKSQRERSRNLPRLRVPGDPPPDSAGHV